MLTHHPAGTAYIAQCPIARGSSFLYNFTVEEPAG